VGDPVHVLGAALHRDFRAGREREPFERYTHALGQVECGKDTFALGLRQRTHLLVRVAKQRDAGHPFGILRGHVSYDADDDIGAVLTVGTVDRHQFAGPVEVILDEITRRQAGLHPFARGQHAQQLVRVGESPLPHAHDLLVVVGERPDRLITQLAEAKVGTAAGGRRYSQQAVAQLARVGVGHPGEQHHLLDAQALDLDTDPVGERLQFVALQRQRGPDVEDHPVPIEPIGGGAFQLHLPDGGQRFHQHPLEVRNVYDAPAGVSDRVHVAHFGQCEETLVFRVVARNASKEVDVLHRGRRSM
jgi:hypothetical protein